MRTKFLKSLVGLAAASLFALAAPAQAAANFTIIVADAPGEGFNDPTPATPVGGNPGTTLGQQRLYTPIPLAQGSSVSHWDTSAFRNLLMEPSINADLTHFVYPPYDLTLPMFKDIGW